jgi:hypothetical protein
MVKFVDSIQYHVWSDALHARELARQTENKWDRGAYVRWAIQTAWTAFENVCMDALETSTLGMRFRDNFDEAVKAKGLSPVVWGGGIWQKILGVYSTRKKFVHVVPSISQDCLMTPIEEADTAIEVLRDGIRAVCDLTSLAHPPWAADDSDVGWRGTQLGFGVSVHGYVVRAGTPENDPNAVRITFVHRGQEHLSEIAPPGTPHGALLDRLSSVLSVPAESVKAYRGHELLEERPLNLRR